MLSKNEAICKIGFPEKAILGKKQRHLSKSIKKRSCPNPAKIFDFNQFLTSF